MYNTLVIDNNLCDGVVQDFMGLGELPEDAEWISMFYTDREAGASMDMVLNEDCSKAYTYTNRLIEVLFGLCQGTYWHFCADCTGGGSCCEPSRKGSGLTKCESVSASSRWALSNLGKPSIHAQGTRRTEDVPTPDDSVLLCWMYLIYLGVWCYYYEHVNVSPGDGEFT